MNQRIRELAEQAGFFPAELTQVGPSVERLAELIVEECMSINRQRMFPGKVSDIPRVAHNNALLCANGDMKSHFFGDDE
jgi:hypothetical protein